MKKISLTYKDLVVLVCGILIGAFLVGLPSSFLAFLGAIIAVIVGAALSWLGSIYTERRNYIINAQNVIFISAKQIGSLENIKKHFDVKSRGENKYREVPGLLKQSNEWQLSKNEILSLNNGKKDEVIKIIDKLVFESSAYDDLLMSIQDHCQCSLDLECKIKNNVKPDRHDLKKLKELYVAVCSRLEKLDIKTPMDLLSEYLDRKFPGKGLFIKMK